MVVAMATFWNRAANVLVYEPRDVLSSSPHDTETTLLFWVAT